MRRQKLSSGKGSTGIADAIAGVSDGKVSLKQIKNWLKVMTPIEAMLEARKKKNASHTF